MSEFEFADVRSAAQSLRHLQKRMHLKVGAAANAAHDAVSRRDQVEASVRRKHLGEWFDKAVIHAAVISDICSPTRSTLPTTHLGVIAVAEKAVEAAEILQSTQALFEKHLIQFNEASDKAVKEAKLRVSQLNDYTNRLGTSLTNLNKVLGDERMARAMENADKIAAALKLLDALQQRGNLDKIIAALQAK